MDLTKNHPRSVKHPLAGVIQAARTCDKARAFNAGALGEYHYNCPMDQALFRFLGTEHAEFARKAAELGEAEFEGWLRDAFLSKKSAAEIERWNREWLAHAPDKGSEAESYFLDLRDRIAPGRSDITTWADLLDAEEGRDVPRRHAA